MKNIDKLRDEIENTLELFQSEVIDQISNTDKEFVTKKELREILLRTLNCFHVLSDGIDIVKLAVDNEK